VGENQNQPFQLSFNPSLRVDFHGSRVTSDGGLVLVRELDERLEFSDLIARYLTDSRAKNTQLPLADLLRQRWNWTKLQRLSRTKSIIHTAVPRVARRTASADNIRFVRDSTQSREASMIGGERGRFYRYYVNRLYVPLYIWVLRL